MHQGRQIQETRSDTSMTIETCKGVQDQAQVGQVFVEMHIQNERTKKVVLGVDPPAL